MTAESTKNGNGKNGKTKGHRKPVEFVRHPDTGEIVNGLRLHKGTSLYYRIDEKTGETRAKNHYYPKRGLQGVAYLRATIREHQAFLAGYDLPTTAFIPTAETVYDQFGSEIPPIATVDDKGLLISGHRIPLKAIYTWIHDQIGNPVTRQDFALAVGIPELAYLEKLRPSALSLSLEVIGNRYLDKTPPLDSKTKRDSRQYWDEFKTIVSVVTVAELTSDHMRNYRDTVNSNRQRDNLSPSYVRARFACIKAIFRHAQTEGEDMDNLSSAVTLCRMLKQPKQNGVSAHPISMDDFNALLKVADTKWKSILYLSLNCAFYPVDVASVLKDHIDLKAGTLCNRRTKTGVPRIAVLWARTISALKTYQREYPHDGKTVFVSAYGKAYDPNHIGRGFRKLRSDAGLPDTVRFEHIRDAAQTYATRAKASPLEVDMLLGHKTGIRDNYTERDATMVADACKRLETYCFGNGKNRPS